MEGIVKTYKEWFQEAIERTKRLGLDSPMTHLFEHLLTQPSKEISPSSYQSMEEYWCHHSRTMHFPPELRAGACAMVHPVTCSLMYQNSLQANKPLTGCVTIGTIVWDGDTCFEISEEKLLAFLEEAKADPTAPFPFHTWITKDNFTVVDLCFPSWQCIQNGESLDLREAGALKLFGPPDAIKQSIKIEFQPYLVGATYLGKTGAITPEGFLPHRNLEEVFVKHFYARK